MSTMPPIGFMRIVCDATEALADDASSIPMDGLVDLEPVGIPRTRPYVIAHDTIIQIRKIRCKLENGKLIPPLDGTDGTRDPVSDLPNPAVELLAPLQAHIDLTGWAWKATFLPPAGGRWQTFTLLFTGKSDETINLASSALATTHPELTSMPRVWHVDVPGGDDPVDWIPEESIIGDWLFDTTTSNLYVTQP